MSQPEVTAPRGPEPEDLVQSVSRALRVLEVVTTSPGLPVKAIARRSGLNLSTTYHLVRTLAYEGYVRRLPDGCYDVGAELPRRFHDVVESLGRPPQSRDVLSHLVQVTGLSAYLGRLSGSGMVVAEVVEGPGSPYLEDFEVGLEVAAHATALGKALLAAMPRASRREYLRDQGLPAFTAQTVTDADALEGWLRSVDPMRPGGRARRVPRRGVVRGRAGAPSPRLGGRRGRWWSRRAPTRCRRRWAPSCCAPPTTSLPPDTIEGGDIES